MGAGQVDVGGGATLAVETSGTGPPLLLVHPSGTDRTLWDPLLPYLPGRTLVRYDLRGHGRSTPGAGDFRHAGDLLAVLDALGLDRVDAAGASYGGQVAVEAAALAPDRIGALALVGASMPGHAWSEQVVGPAVAQEAALAAGDVDRAVRLWLETWVRGPHRDRPDPGLAGRLDPAVRVAFASAGAGEDRGPDAGWAEVLAGTPRRALVLVGELDLDDCRRIADRLGALLGTGPVVVPGTGHLLGLEDPATVGRLLADFFAG